MSVLVVTCLVTSELILLSLGFDKTSNMLKLGSVHDLDMYSMPVCFVSDNNIYLFNNIKVTQSG